MNLKPENWNEEIKGPARCELRLDIPMPGARGGIHRTDYEYGQLGPLIDEVRRILQGRVSLNADSRILFDGTLWELAMEVLRHDAALLPKDPIK